MLPYLTQQFYNPSSVYRPALDVHEKIESVREQIAAFIGAKPEEIYFTSGGSESNAWAIQGYFPPPDSADPDDHIVITTPLEHASIELLTLSHPSIWTKYVAVDADGKVSLDSLRETLKSALDYYPAKFVLATIQMANNEIGTVQNMKAIAKVCHEFGVTLHTDAIQAFGHVPIHVDELGVDMLSASGHKIGAPKGIGFLYVREGVELAPLIYGTQEGGLRGGTENVAGIVGLGKALELTQEDANRPDRLRLLRDDLIRRLEAMGCTLNGHPSDRLPNHVSVTLPKGALAESMIYMLDAAGICVSAGSACHGYSTSQSSILAAIGQTKEESLRVLRLTLPDNVTRAQIDAVVEEIRKQIFLLSSMDS